jgi:hypothetical protein
MPDNKSINDGSQDEGLIKRLEADLRDIETREILQGLTPRELTERGFTGANDIVVERTRFKETTEREKLVFEEGVEYERLADQDDISSIDIERILFVKDVALGQLIATREPNETVAFNAGRNVKKGVVDGRECFHAAVKGKVVIIHDTMHIVPSDIDCTIQIRILADKMQALLDCTPGYG